mmetsp:Transcript_11360/g.35131  ORF Transcript_11360/g.35131 Transcript_11360/m.35131 type:complete len:272 (-) Transcript_11360:37-852(-)
MLRHKATLDAQLEIGEELAQELASARADATRHGQECTDLRAQLASTRKEFAKQRNASRDLALTSEELDAALLKLRGTRHAESELEASRKRQALLERQVRELQTRSSVEYPPRQAPLLGPASPQGLGRSMSVVEYPSRQAPPANLMSPHGLGHSLSVAALVPSTGARVDDPSAGGSPGALGVLEGGGPRFSARSSLHAGHLAPVTPPSGRPPGVPPRPPAGPDPRQIWAVSSLHKFADGDVANEPGLHEGSVRCSSSAPLRGKSARGPSLTF